MGLFGLGRDKSENTPKQQTPAEALIEIVRDYKLHPEVAPRFRAHLDQLYKYQRDFNAAQSDSVAYGRKEYAEIKGRTELMTAALTTMLADQPWVKEIPRLDPDKLAEIAKTVGVDLCHKLAEGGKPKFPVKPEYSGIRRIFQQLGKEATSEEIKKLKLIETVEPSVVIDLREAGGVGFTLLVVCDIQIRGAEPTIEEFDRRYRYHGHGR